MATGTRIADAQEVTTVLGTEKVPVSDGSGTPKYIKAKNLNDTSAAIAAANQAAQTANQAAQGLQEITEYTDQITELTEWKNDAESDLEDVITLANQNASNITELGSKLSDVYTFSTAPSTESVSIKAGAVKVTFSNNTDNAGYMSVLAKKGTSRVLVMSGDLVNANTSKTLTFELPDDSDNIELRNPNNLTDLCYRIECNMFTKDEFAELEEYVDSSILISSNKALQFYQPENHGYINQSGQVVASDDYRYSDYIEITNPSSAIIQVGNVIANYGLTFYDSQKNFISYTDRYQLIKLSTISNVKYVRIANWYVENNPNVLLRVIDSVNEEIKEYIKPCNYKYQSTSAGSVDYTNNILKGKSQFVVVNNSDNAGYVTVRVYSSNDTMVADLSGYLLSAKSIYIHDVNVVEDACKVRVTNSNGIDLTVYVISGNETDKSLSYNIHRNLSNTIVVDAKGEGDYTSLMDALKYANDSSTNHVTIHVMPGRYFMGRSLYGGNKDGADYYYNPNKRNVSIIGTDRNSCILYNDIGYYDASQYDNSVIGLGGNCTIANLTLVSSNERYAEASSQHTGWSGHKVAYCIHLDSDVNEGDCLEIINCKFIGNNGPCIGSGHRPNYTIIIKSCEFISTLSDDCDFTFHGCIYQHVYALDSQSTAVNYPNQVTHVEDCIIKTTNAPLAVCFTGVNRYQDNNKITYRMIRNVCKTTDSENAFKATYQIKDEMSYGNNVQAMNG